ncbi:MAG: LTA synthase family protein, partial [Muribaculaceae bacterium]|nr:LTA synthase family protein [Muribaculaceae bacterium]
MSVREFLAGRRSGCVAPWIATAYNILLLFVVYAVARFEYWIENYSYFSEVVSLADLPRLLCSGMVFDTPGIMYTNAVYILMMLLPLHYKEHPGYYKVCKWVFIIVNSLALLVNVADSVFFPYTLKRTTWDTISEFGNESNLVGIVGVEIIRHWYLLIFVALVIWGMWRLYITPYSGITRRGGRAYYIVSFAGFVIAVCIVASGIRGGWLNHWYLYLIALLLGYISWACYSSSRKVLAVIAAVGAIVSLATAPAGGWRHRDIRPIALSNANAFAHRPVETSLILNTPFALVRTINSQSYVNPHYFADDAKAEKIFTPQHKARIPAEGDSILFKGRNVVIIILESFGEEYIGSLNRKVLGTRSVSYAPFMDSLVNVSMRWRHSYDNGTKSIDAMPSILASIPKLGKPFILTSSAMEPIDGLPALLNKEGYTTAFFHGARTGSMGFDGFARLVGFGRYYGREDFNNDVRFKGDADFDGYWAIWDEPLLQYFALQMSELPQPFMTAVFTASSHHPFRVPRQYEGYFPAGELPIHKTIGYSDMALRRFFETAAKQPWYDNTLFVITNDHTNARAYDEYKSDIGAFHGPLLIYDPSGRLEAGEWSGIAQQIDIMPT